MDIDVSQLVSLLRRHKAELPGDENDQDEFIDQVARLAARTSDDRKAATSMAADVVKSLVQAGLAAVVALGAFVRWVWRANGYWEIAVVLFVVSGALFFANMIVGSRTLAFIYRRAEGRDNPEKVPWATEPYSPRFQRQALLVGLGILFFAFGIISSVVGPQTP